jgi:hypothetical protein
MKFVERPKFLILLYRTWNAIEWVRITRTCTIINVKFQIIFNNSLGKTCDFYVQKRRVYTSMRQRQKACRPYISNMKFVERSKFLVLFYRASNAIEQAPITGTCINHFRITKWLLYDLNHNDHNGTYTQPAVFTTNRPPARCWKNATYSPFFSLACIIKKFNHFRITKWLL